MARPLRLHVPNAIYHVMIRGNNKDAIFYDATDYNRYLELLARGLERFQVRCYAVCALRNHAHLVLSPGELPLWRLMQQVNSNYCQWFNRRHRRIGHVLQGRYRSLIVDNDVYFLRLLRYVSRNPVEAGLVAHPSDWAWSTYRATAGLAAAPPYLDLAFVWNAFDSCDPTKAQGHFKAFVEMAEDDPLQGRLLTGSIAFKQRLEPLLAVHRSEPEYVYAERYATRPALQDILSNGGDDSAALRLAVSTAFEKYAYTLKEIGTAIGRPSSTVWSWARRGRAEDPETSMGCAETQISEADVALDRLDSAPTRAAPG